MLTLNQRKIIPTWDNILIYYESTGSKLDFILVDFLNEEENYKELEKLGFEDLSDNESIIKSISIDLIKSEGLTFESYSSLLNSIPLSYSFWDKIGFEKLNSKKVEHLILKRYLNLSVSNFDKLEEHFSNLVIKFLEVSEPKLIDEFDNLSIEDYHIEGILNSKQIDQNNKERVVQKLDGELIIGSSNIAKLVCDVIADSSVTFLQFDVIQSLFKNSISTKNRIKVLNLYFEELQKSEIETLINMLPGEFPRVLVNRKKPKLKYTQENLTFAQNLKRRKQISSYKIEKNGLYIRIQANN